MAPVRSVLDVKASPERAWALITDWRAHGRWIPFTVVSIDEDSPSPSGLGTRFTGRTALGPIGFDDPMTVTEWQPPDGSTPGHCRLVKRGRWVTGWAEISVSSQAGGSRLVWIEDIAPRWTPKFADPVVSRIGKVLFDGTLRKLAAELDG